MTTMEELAAVPLGLWIGLGLGLLAQGIWIFNDAGKRGMNKWLWGFLGLLNTPTNLIVYLIVSRGILGTYKCSQCESKYNKSYRYCPYCGTEKKEDQ